MIVDTVAMPVKDVEAEDRHRRVASGEPLPPPGRSGRLNIVLETNDGTQARPDGPVGKVQRKTWAGYFTIT